MSSEGSANGSAQPRPATSLDRLDGVLGGTPFYPLLLAAYPVLLLYSDNVVDVSLAEVVGPLLLVIGITTLGLALLSRLWHSPRRAAIVISAIVVPFLGVGMVVDALAPSWPDDFLLRLHLTALAGWLAIVGLAIYAASKLDGRLGTVTQVLNIASVALILLAILPILDYARATSANDAPDSAVVAAAASDPPATPVASDGARDIYHLVFDRYGSESAMRAGPGIDNSEFTDWLRERGFDVVDDARANYERTALSLSSVHSMGLHDELAGRLGPDNPGQGPLVDLIRSSAAASYLRGRGYEYTVAGSWWRPSAYSDLADRVVEPSFLMSFGSALLDRSVLPSLEAVAAFTTSRSIDGTAGQQAETTISQFENVAALIDDPGPDHIFAHFLVPHDPYLFLADGTVAPDEASYETQLEYTNAQLKTLIEQMLALPAAEQPIIILQADEGPYPDDYAAGRDGFDWESASDRELVTKFGVLHALYLPGEEGAQPLPDGMSLVNTYPEVLRRYLGAEIPAQPDHTYAMRSGGYYDLHDITERLDLAFERLLRIEDV